MSVLTTDRLVLREFTAADASFVRELLNTPGWLQYVGDRNVHSDADAAAYIENRLMAGYRKHGFGFYLVALKGEGTPVGMCGLVRREGLDDVDIGFAFLPEHTGKGYALEAAQAVMALAKESLRLPRIVAITLPENNSSIRLLERIGMKNQGRVQLPDDPEELLLFEWKKADLT